MRLSPSGKRRKRLFRRGDLEVLLLSLLTRGPRHGYELTSEIEALAGSEYSPSTGTLYPALRKLEAAELVTVSSPAGSRRRIYALTAEGETRLKGDASSLKRVTDDLASVRSPDPEAAGDLIRSALALLQSAVEEHAHNLSPSFENKVSSKLKEISLSIKRHHG